MHLQFFYTPGCVECRAARILLKRIAPDYPDLQVDEIDVAALPEEAGDSEAVAAPRVLIDGRPVASKHVREAELRRLIRKAAMGEPEQMLLPLGLPPPASTGNGAGLH